jgi:hypothetical protein
VAPHCSEGKSVIGRYADSASRFLRFYDDPCAVKRILRCHAHAPDAGMKNADKPGRGKSDWRDFLIQIIERTGSEVIEVNKADAIPGAMSACPDLVRSRFARRLCEKRSDRKTPASICQAFVRRYTGTTAKSVVLFQPVPKKQGLFTFVVTLHAPALLTHCP